MEKLSRISWSIYLLPSSPLNDLPKMTLFEDAEKIYTPGFFGPLFGKTVGIPPINFNSRLAVQLPEGAYTFLV